MTNQAIQFPIHPAERETTERQYRDDPIMLETLRHAHATQDSLDADIRNWHQPATATETSVMAWLTEKGCKAVTKYDYRRHARAVAASLLFKITDGLPHHMALRAVNEDKWSDDEKRDYWRCVAICSSTWEAAE